MLAACFRGVLKTKEFSKAPKALLSEQNHKYTNDCALLTAVGLVSGRFTASVSISEGHTAHPRTEEKRHCTHWDGRTHICWTATAGMRATNGVAPKRNFVM